MKLLAVVLSSCVLVACGGGGSSTPSTSTSLTVTGTAATGLAIPGATITGKCKAGSGSATTISDGSYTLTVTDGQLPCVLQITNPADGIKLHTVVMGTGSSANANITPLTEMVTARVLGVQPNVFFAAFDTAVAIQKITSTAIQVAQTNVGLVLTGTVDTAALGNFISAPLKAATHGSPTTGDAQDKLLDALKLKLSTEQLGMVTTALASNQTADAIKQTLIGVTAVPTTPSLQGGSFLLSISAVVGSAVNNAEPSFASIDKVTVSGTTFASTVGVKYGTKRIYTIPLTSCSFGTHNVDVQYVSGATGKNNATATTVASCGSVVSCVSIVDVSRNYVGTKVQFTSRTSSLSCSP